MSAARKKAQNPMTTAASVAKTSTTPIISALVVPAGTRPGQRTRNGTLKPPSQTSCFPPRNAPLIFSPASSASLLAPDLPVGW
jgi:hypothetical protein